jgi:hypothetical protein
LVWLGKESLGYVFNISYQNSNPFLAAHCIHNGIPSKYRIILGDHNIDVLGDGEYFINIGKFIVESILVLFQPIFLANVRLVLSLARIS